MIFLSYRVFFPKAIKVSINCLVKIDFLPVENNFPAAGSIDDVFRIQQFNPYPIQ